jgi:hypothetical protein
MQSLTHQDSDTTAVDERRPVPHGRRQAAYVKSGVAALLIGLAPLVIGCSDRYASTVSGSVTLDAQPLTSGTVTFHPVSGGPVAYAVIGADGSYSLKTGDTECLPPGAYLITVVTTEQPPANLPRAATPPIGRLITPEKYSRPKTTDLKYEVDAGSNEINLVLKSRP